MMDQGDREDQCADAAGRGDAPAGPASGAASADASATEAPAGAGRRILLALVLLPWIVGYGSLGAWAVAFGARSAAAGHATVDAGYTRMVTPGGVILVGALLLAAFVTLLIAALLLIYGTRSRAAWVSVAVAAAALSAGAVWAGVQGELVPLLWVLFFFGLVYALVVAVVGAVRAGREERELQP